MTERLDGTHHRGRLHQVPAQPLRADARRDQSRAPDRPRRDPARGAQQGQADGDRAARDRRGQGRQGGARAAGAQPSPRRMYTGRETILARCHAWSRIERKGRGVGPSRPAPGPRAHPVLGYSSEGRRKIEEVYEAARAAHAGQYRQSGEAYITHPLGVAKILANGTDRRRSAALLHDVVEDTPPPSEISALRKAVAELVDGVSKIDRTSSRPQHAQAENFRKMLLAMARDVRVILIKLADRLHNMRARRRALEAGHRARRSTSTRRSPTAWAWPSTTSWESSASITCTQHAARFSTRRCARRAATGATPWARSRRRSRRASRNSRSTPR